MIIIWAVVVFVLVLFIKDYFSPESVIGRLQKRAAEKRIGEKALNVLHEIANKSCLFEDSIIKIEYLPTLQTIKISEIAPGILVFEATLINSYSRKTGTHLKRTDDGGYSLEEEYDHGDEYFEVEGYITGSWESHLNKLYAKAIAQKEAKSEAMLLSEKEKRRKKFGL